MNQLLLLILINVDDYNFLEGYDDCYALFYVIRLTRSSYMMVGKQGK